MSCFPLGETDLKDAYNSSKNCVKFSYKSVSPGSLLRP